MSPQIKTLCCALLALTAAGARAGDVDLKQPVMHVANKTVPATIDMPEGRTVKLTNWQTTLNEGDVAGQFTYGWFCGGAQPLRFVKQTSEFMQRELTRAFNERTTSLGLAQPAATGSAFDAGSAGAGSADFRIGATLQALDYRICATGQEVKGDAYAKVKWEIFSTRRQKVVWTSVSEGGYSSKDNVTNLDFNKRLWLSVVNNALAEAGFLEAIRSDGMSSGSNGPALAALKFNTGQVVAGNVNQNGTKLLQAVVTVQSGVGSGSGFYIGQEGYLLTNYHVVADAKFVKVKLANGHSLVGEVVREDKVRDVALIRTDPITDSVLGVRRDEPGVGEEVYALGSPFGEILSGTLTRGVLSSRRVMDGTAFLQSDVAVNPGNSGGPLIDATGRVVGITQMGLKGAQSINMFIPIGEALEKLSLTVQAAP